MYARRIDPVRARILNVPLPASGWRCGDTALHDGAPTGTRPDGQGGEVSVFNAFERWRPSETPTHTAFARCPAAANAEAITGLLEQHGWTAEDWTHSLRYICLRCSYGIPHEHETDAAKPPTTAGRPNAASASPPLQNRPPNCTPPCKAG